MELFYYGDSILSKPVDWEIALDENLRREISQMKEVMEDENGCGLSANQVGLNKPLFITSDLVFIKPKILEQSGEQLGNEGCLSLPDIIVKIKRPQKVLVEFIDENFKEREEWFSDFDAVVISHEYDHLKGITFLDHLTYVKRELVKKKMLKWRKKYLG